MRDLKDPIKHLQRCIRRERRAAQTARGLAGWTDMDGMVRAEKALAEAERKTDKAVQYVRYALYGDEQ